MNSATNSEIQRVIDAMRRNAVIWGVLIALLAASLILSAVRLIDHPGAVVVVCQDGNHGRCVAVQR